MATIKYTNKGTSTNRNSRMKVQGGGVKPSTMKKTSTTSGKKCCGKK